jgi:pyridinium-3,5-bisthiocarboxylic acid mononucleotide nickel chelatase
LICFDLSSPYSRQSLIALTQNLAEKAIPDRKAAILEQLQGLNSLLTPHSDLKNALTLFPESTENLVKFFALNEEDEMPVQVLSAFIRTETLFRHLAPCGPIISLPARLHPQSPEKSLRILKNIPVRLDPEAAPVEPELAATVRILFGPFRENPVITLGEQIVGQDPDDPAIQSRVFFSREQSHWIRESIGSLETNVDDITPQVLAFCMTRIMEEGALDFTVTPAGMKKGRMSHKIEILCEEKDIDRFTEFLFLKTPTFGIRQRTVNRAVLKRSLGSISTQYGIIKVKKGYFQEKCIKIMPEFEDIITISRKTGIPVQVIYNNIMAEAIKNIDGM